MLRLFSALMLCLALAVAVTAQVASPASEPVAIDLDDLVEETQQAVRGEDRAGLVWWIPVEFWETSDPASASEMQLLRDYMMVAVVAGGLGPFGSINFVPEADIRRAARFRDPSGAVHAPLGKVSGDAQILADVLRPILRASLGPMGENIVVLFFPGRDAEGRLLVDPRTEGSFAIELRDLPDIGSSVHEWNLPLTSLSPPRFCPTGNERVQANWKFCPWHGTPLD